MKTDKLTKSKARVKAHGEVFTPPALVNEMLDKLPPHCWLPEKTFFEPACGTGNFLVAILERKLAAGHPPLQALGTIWAVDILGDNVVESRERLLGLAVAAGVPPAAGRAVIEAQVRQGDTLKESLDLIFSPARGKISGDTAL